MRNTPAAKLWFVLLTPLVAINVFAFSPQSPCTALNAAKGEGKFTGQISSAPDGRSLEVTYDKQTVLVHYSDSVTICQSGQPASPDALTRGATVSLFGALRRNGQNIEIDAARIFVAGSPVASRTSPQPIPPKIQETQPPTSPHTSSQEIPGRSAIPNSVILGGATHAEMMRRLRVVNSYRLSDMRSHPQMAFGEAQIDFRPMLDNSHALFNVAQRLHEITQHVQVLEESSEISEVERGLVLHQVLSYRILPGKCSDPTIRLELARAGIQCFTRAAMSERISEFSTPGRPRYIPDPQKREEAIAAYQRNVAISVADATKHIAELRQALADPAQRAAIEAEIGKAEATRMTRLTDDQLKEEMINSSTQRYEETMFVPKLTSWNYAHPQHLLAIAPNAGEMNAAQHLLRDGVPEHSASPANFPKLLKATPARPLRFLPSGNDRAGDADLGTYVFLTGFTIGHDYEWHWGAEITVNWCVVGCSATYGLELHAGFNYGFGLRFPIRAQLKYHVAVHGNNSEQATLTAAFEPINGTIDDFFATGIPADQLYDAKELVAQVGADAGFNLNLPGLSVSPGFSVGADFTDKLPEPYTKGHFVPPAPGSHGIDSDFVLDGVDLLGGLLNYGVAGGQLLPAVNINLHSDKLQFTLNDEIQKRQTRLNSPSQSVAVAIAPEIGGNGSHFSFGNPVYNLGFTLTPGLNPRLFIDIDVWSQNWNWPIWFPQLAVTVPANGIDFSCHTGTTCVLDFQPVYNASTGQSGDISKEIDAADRTLTGGGCQRNGGRKGDYLCPVKGMLGLCKAMLSNGTVSSCNPLIPDSTDQILRRGHCTSNNGNYVCPRDMMGLCGLYLKNEVILSCTQAK